MVKIIWTTLVTAALLAGCSSGDADSEDSAPRAESTTASSSPIPVPPHCGNPEGGKCLNELTAGQQYATEAFEPAISYSVAEDGWSNEEDLHGNFLLLPPGNDLDGVNAGTSDFIGVYTSVVASEVVDTTDCITDVVKGVPPTPEGFVAWMRSQRVLDVSGVGPVTLGGGLTGLVADVAIARGGKAPVCVFASSKLPIVLLFNGIAPSSLEHGVIRGMTMRLYLVARGDQLMVVELDDIDAAPGDLDSLSAQVERMQFAA